ncbi:NAD(P)/FAD-dependent oxidoreductase [Brevibacterium litoralis]|uniref:NAD(P)/FAD-dependent oxidoreductase n=1 Tax=Brevibacterium litoralis TaxID=3138935 RepID=UPI0032EE8685
MYSATPPPDTDPTGANPPTPDTTTAPPAVRGTLPTSASVVVIGGGIMGVAAAHELARDGVDVVLVERDALGSGSTCKAAGGVRTSFSDETNILLGAHSLETFRRFPETFGQDIDLHTPGYLFLLADAESATVFEASTRLQNDLGMPTRMVSPAEVAALNPWVRTDDLVAGALDPAAGHCTPESAVAGLARAARAAGVRILTHTSAAEVVVEHGHVTGVRTSAGDIACDHVVCTAGAWSAGVAATAGIDLPVTPLRRQIAVTDAVDFDTRDLPFTLDFATSFYFHGEGAGLLMGSPERTDLHDFDMRQDPAWQEYLGELLAHRAPALGDVRLASGWAGLYECTPDHNALIGSAREVEGFHYACGFSGHGFLQGPAVGVVLRDLVLGRAPEIDVSGLSVERFTTSALRPEVNII